MTTAAAGATAADPSDSGSSESGGGEPVEHVDVLIVGAGLSGIGAGHWIQANCPWASYAIFEARDAIGGTWDLFRYPGIRSDSDMYTLGYSFRPWTQEKSIADGDSILDYIVDTAREEGIDQHIRFRHRIVSADWSSEEARWHVTARRTPDHDDDPAATGEEGDLVRLTCGFVFSCCGYYRYDHGHEPDFPGIEAFEGRLVHPQHWPEDLDYDGKQVVVIGSGATAVTLVPAMARTAGHVTMLQRSPTYIAPLPAKDPVATLLQKILPARWSGPVIRWFKALTTQASYNLSKRWPKAMRKVFRKLAESQLPKSFDVDTHFNPTYDPWDQRVCAVPDGDLFQSIKDGTSSVATDTIDTFTPTGIRLASGDELPADIVVSATGLELLFIGGMTVTVDGERVEASDRLMYKGMMLEGVPNMAAAIGYTNASWTLKCDLTCQYVTRLLNRMHETGMRQCTAVDEQGLVSDDPLLGLTSGYVQRAAHLFPKQGTRHPWRVYQSYLQDYRSLRRQGIDDGAMVFSNPAPTPASGRPAGSPGADGAAGPGDRPARPLAPSAA